MQGKAWLDKASQSKAGQGVVRQVKASKWRRERGIAGKTMIGKAKQGKSS
jgi:hypothetical protein